MCEYFSRNSVDYGFLFRWRQKTRSQGPSVGTDFWLFHHHISSRQRVIWSIEIFDNQPRSRADICCQDRLSHVLIEVEKPETLGSKASQLLEAGDLREGGQASQGLDTQRDTQKMDDPHRLRFYSNSFAAYQMHT